MQNDPKVAITKVSTEKIFPAYWMKGTAVGNTIIIFECTSMCRFNYSDIPEEEFMPFTYFLRD
jgi:hypothetical protein